ncbi:type III polyketide synthase [Risungbinella massiliensis]|uniref:type III polyketide synthase n=1 Tax=Risungbinella massiliensis TaxID=1329796 RepID=UPI0005CC4E39|nr:3-oxoacyl-[acyl-carrier-protein] synthase III C-terminal domain-containing protein [Risungbinella massiliensis]
MAQVIAVGTAVPPFQIDQSTIREFAKRMFQDRFSDIERYLPIFENTNIERRSFSKPIEWFEEVHHFPTRNEAYVEMASKLAIEAIQKCIEKSPFTLEQIDHLFFVSSTGLSTPSIDAHLINQLQLKRNIRRTPIWGLGCAGGVAGLSRAYEYVTAFPDQIAVVVTVELCGLTFRRNDLSKSNLVATSLFADGAAAVLVAGRKVSLQEIYPIIHSSHSTIWYNSLDVMGWDVAEDGLQVVFSRDIPTIVKEYVEPVVRDYLQEHSLSIQDITRMISHPGGKKVLHAYEEALNVPPERFQHAYDVLRDNGNMSSATVLFVLEKELEQIHTNGEWGLMSALGPGFSSELLLLQW